MSGSKSKCQILPILAVLLGLNITGCGGNLPDAANSSPTKEQINPLSVAPTSATVNSSQTLQLLVSNGVKPYRFNLVSGGGSISTDGLYTPPATNQVSKILVYDQNNTSIEVNITSYVPDVQPIPISAPNPSVADAATAGTCPGGYGDKGSFAGGRLCLAPAASQSTSVIGDIYVTPEGAHVVGGPGCRAGYTEIGGFDDCGGGNCYGNQQVCASRLSVTANMAPGSYVKDAYFTGWGAHAVGGPGCNAGYIKVGSGADCSSPVFNGFGFSACYGNVVLCVAK